jgi:DNA-binding MarR family transcriptional regulator
MPTSTRACYANDNRWDRNSEVKLALTEAGLAALPKLRECSVRVLNHFMRGFSQAEARQLEGFLVRMLENA